MTDRERYPEPRTVRDLWLMRKTCPKVEGNIEYMRSPGLPKFSRDFTEGMVTHIAMTVTPYVFNDTVKVTVYREEVRNLRNGVFNPHRTTLWEKEYHGFDEFRESPFWDVTMKAWDGSRTAWDTHLLDDHETSDDGDRWYIWCHYLKHYTDWLGNDCLSGEVGSLNVYAQDDGNVTIDVDGKTEFDGPIQDLVRVIREHDEMRKRLKSMEEHGLNLKDGTLSVRLWGGGDA